MRPGLSPVFWSELPPRLDPQWQEGLSVWILRKRVFSQIFVDNPPQDPHRCQRLQMRSLPERLQGSDLPSRTQANSHWYTYWNILFAFVLICMSFYRPYWSKNIFFVFRRKAIFVRRLWTWVPHQVWHAGMHFVISIECWFLANKIIFSLNVILLIVVGLPLLQWK